MQTSVQSAQKMSFRRPVARTACTNSVSSQGLRQRAQRPQTARDAPEQLGCLFGEHERPGARARVAQARDDDPAATLLEMPDRDRRGRLPEIELADLPRPIGSPLEGARRRREQCPHLAQVVVEDRLRPGVAERLDQLADPLPRQLGILAQQPMNLALERIELRRPRPPLIARRLRGTQHSPDRDAIPAGAPDDLLDRQTADEVHPPNLRPLLHLDQRPPPRPLDDRAAEASTPPGHNTPTSPKRGEISTGARG
jgi:hypothetical protein